MPDACITCHCRPKHSHAAAIVLRALERSFGKAQVVEALQPSDAAPGTLAAYICPQEETLAGMADVLRRGGKVLAFGPTCAAALPLLGLRHEEPDPSWKALDAAELCVTDPVHLSPGAVVYGDHPLALTSPLRKRPFRRYDYAEWNNLGFGAITTDGSAFAAAPGYRAEAAAELAVVAMEGRESPIGTYIALQDEAQGSLLWCARPVGPVDSVEWHLVERFLCDWRPELTCLPCLMQTPRGCTCLVTMRLDCDEAIASARPLFEWYRTRGLPLSAAVKTSLDMSPVDIALLEDIRATGGTLLSHSHTHPKNWGMDAAQAEEEARLSREWFFRQWPDEAPPALAVSPFHTNPPYALQSLVKVGYTGFVGGIIDNDPAYCLGRAGLVPFVDGLVSISQQSMLHGDSYRNQGHSVEAHVQGFRSQLRARGIFGYLDHPFSRRYQYGWDSEEQRIQAHGQLVETILRQDGVQFWSQRRCFDFIETLARVPLRLESGKVIGGSAIDGIEYRLRGEVAPVRQCS